MSTTPDAPIIHARGLTKRFGDFTAVDGIDFDVARGESFGFLGPNGAGKTSTMRMIGCVSPVTAGTLTVLGMDPASDGSRIRARLGVVPQQDTLDMELTVEENLVIYGRYFDLSYREARARAAELLDFVQLKERAQDQVEPLSGGMKRRLTIARGLINEPEAMLLDEPTTGLDPQARHLVWERLYRLKQQGVTLILTTHYMDEAEQLCDRLVVMDKARIVAEGSPRALIEEHSSREVLELRFEDAPGARPRRPARRARRAGRAAARPAPALHVGRRGRRRGRPSAGLATGEPARAPLLARGRLPAPDRPEPRRVSAAAPATRPSRAAPTGSSGSSASSSTTSWSIGGRGAGRSSRRSSPRSSSSPRSASGLGSFIDEANPGGVDGVPYLVFLAPGLLAGQAMNTGTFESTYPVMAGIRWLKTYVAIDPRAALAVAHRGRAARCGSGCGWSSAPRSSSS